MAQGSFSNDDFDKMKADAIRRARQMHSRAIFNSPPPVPPIKEEPKKTPIKSDTNGFSAEGILRISKMLGISSDHLLLFALIFILSQQKDNLPLVIALLYIAM